MKKLKHVPNKSCCFGTNQHMRIFTQVFKTCICEIIHRRGNRTPSKLCFKV